MTGTERAAWLAKRREGIGGSDSAILFGCNPWQSAFALYQDKVGELVDDTDTPATFWGRKLEPAVREAYGEILGRRVLPGVENARHPEIDFMLANTDGEVQPVAVHDGPGVYEGKTTSVFNAAQWDNDVPLYYQVQVQHYLAVTGLQWGSVACLIMGKRDPFVWRDVERNDRFIEALQDRVHTFWLKHVVPRVPPPVDESSSTDKALRLLHPKDNGRLIMLPSEAASWWDRRQDVKKEIKELAKEEQLLTNRLREAIGPASYAMFESGEGFSCKHQYGGPSPTSILAAVAELGGEDLADKVAAKAERPEFRAIRKAGKKTLAAKQKEQENELPEA